MSSQGRYSPNRIRRLISSFSPIRFRDEAGQVKYSGQPVVMLRRVTIRLIRDELARLGAPGGRGSSGTAGYGTRREAATSLPANATAHAVRSREALPDAT